jgi:signal transduction histidine kinase
VATRAGKQSRVDAGLRNILDAYADGVVVVDQDGVVCFANPAAEQLFARRADELVGRMFGFPLVAGATTEVDVLRPLGAPCVVEMRVVRTEWAGRAAYLASLRDVTDRKQAEAARAELIREQARTIETITRVGQAFAGALEEDQLVQAITNAATELTGAQFGAFFYNVLNEHGEAYMLYTLSGAPREAFERFPMPRNTALFGPTFRGEGVVRLDDVTRDPRYGQSPPYYGMPEGHLPVRSYLAAPVASRSGEVLGGLFFGHAEPGVFTERAEQILVAIAAQASVALDNARLYRATRDAVRLRDEFLAAVSHDLKNPLGAVKGTAQLLHRAVRRLDTPEAERIGDGLRRIDAIVTRMTRSIDSLLDITRVQMGQPLPLDRRPTDLVALAREVLDEQRPSADRHQLRLDASLPEVVGAWDSARLERVLENLVSNAVKYSPDGGEITIEIRLEREADQPWAVLAVRDQGIGIPAADLPRIFARFERAGNVVGQIPGTGIGLTAVRQVVEQHGGRIAVDSEEGVGTTFTVRLPLALDLASNTASAELTV